MSTSDEQRLVGEAAQWLTRLHSGHFSTADRFALDQWRAQSPAHQHVWRHAEQLGQRFGTVPPAVGKAVLDRTRQSSSRRAALKAVGVLLAVPSATWFTYRLSTQPAWQADHWTATGEQREVSLPDGSQVHLNTHSALSVTFNEEQRMLRHLTGEMLVQTAPDTARVHRPFTVASAQGLMRALGTRFIVRSTADEHTRLTVLQGAVEITPLNGSSRVVIEAGHQAVFSTSSVLGITKAPNGVDAWLNGVLYAEDMRLADFVQELGRYRPGMLRCDPAVADVRVSGAFQLNNTEQVLTLLTQTLPVQLKTRTRFWVTLAAR